MGIFKEEETNTYYVTVIETLKKRVEVQATSEGEALAKVEEAYNKCDIILDENDFTYVRFKLKKVIDSESDDEDDDES